MEEGTVELPVLLVLGLPSISPCNSCKVENCNKQLCSQKRPGRHESAAKREVQWLRAMADIQLWLIWPNKKHPGINQGTRWSWLWWSCNEADLPSVWTRWCFSLFKSWFACRYVLHLVKLLPPQLHERLTYLLQAGYLLLHRSSSTVKTLAE